MIHIGRASPRALAYLLEVEQGAAFVSTALDSPENVAALAASDWTYMAVDGDQYLAAGGVMEWWPGRGYAWALVAPGVAGNRRATIAVHRAAVRLLDAVPFRRVEAAVAVGFTKARRWIEKLGFVLEAERMVAFTPNGSDAALYARVRRG